jgi:hypothetical protein
MLRMVVLVLAGLFTVTGLILCVLGIFLPGVQTLALGALAVVGLVFERWRYQNKNAAKDADWQRTGERFVDPETGRNVEVLYDPQSGERRYEPFGDR